MKNLLASIAMILAFTAGAQSMPYNPDANGDGYITSPDLLSFLPLFGSQLSVDSTAACDYIGTDYEEWVMGALTGEIVVDSVLIEYHLIDSTTYFTLGCPDTLWNVVSLERSYMVYPEEFVPEGKVELRSNYFGYERMFLLRYNDANNTFNLSITDIEVTCCSGILASFSYTEHQSFNPYQTWWSLPFPQEYSFDENGIDFNHWNGFFEWSTYHVCMPFWHYAD